MVNKVTAAERKAYELKWKQAREEALEKHRLHVEGLKSNPLEAKVFFAEQLKILNGEYVDTDTSLRATELKEFIYLDGLKKYTLKELEAGIRTAGDKRELLLKKENRDKIAHVLATLVTKNKFGKSFEPEDGTLKKIDVWQLGVPQLKALCKSEGLAVSGAKAVLVARLVEKDPKVYLDILAADEEAEDEEESGDEGEERKSKKAKTAASDIGMKVVRHHSSIGYYAREYSKLINQLKKVTKESGVDYFPPVGNFSMTIISWSGKHYRIMMETQEDTPTGGIWCHGPKAKVTASKWIGEISDGWYARTRDTEEEATDAEKAIISKLEKFYNNTDLSADSSESYQARSYGYPSRYGGYAS